MLVEWSQSRAAGADNATKESLPPGVTSATRFQGGVGGQSMPGEAPVTKQMNGASLQRQDPNVKTAGNVRKHALDPDFGSRIQGRQRAKSGIPKVVLAPDYGIREKR